MKLRLLYLPSEGALGDQVAPRAAFKKMLRIGRMEAYQAYSFCDEYRKLYLFYRIPHSRDLCSPKIKLLDFEKTFYKLALWLEVSSFAGQTN